MKDFLENIVFNWFYKNIGGRGNTEFRVFHLNTCIIASNRTNWSNDVFEVSADFRITQTV